MPPCIDIFGSGDICGSGCGILALAGPVEANVQQLLQPHQPRLDALDALADVDWST